MSVNSESFKNLNLEEVNNTFAVIEYPKEDNDIAGAIEDATEEFHAALKSNEAKALEILKPLPTELSVVPKNQPVLPPNDTDEKANIYYEQPEYQIRLLSFVAFSFITYFSTLTTYGGYLVDSSKSAEYSSLFKQILEEQPHVFVESAYPLLCLAVIVPTIALTIYFLEDVVTFLDEQIKYGLDRWNYWQLTKFHEELQLQKPNLTVGTEEYAQAFREFVREKTFGHSA